MKIPIFLSVLAALALVSPAKAFALTPTDNFYVNDYVGLLSDSQKNDMTNRSNFIYSENGAQVVTVIVDYVIGGDANAYATEIFNDFGIGSKNNDSGALLFLAAQDREVQIITGDGMDGYISDSRAGSILDEYFIPSASQGDMAAAVYDTHMQLVSEASALSASSAPSANGVSPQARSNAAISTDSVISTGSFISSIIVDFIVFAFIIGVVILLLKSRRISRGRYSPGYGPSFFLRPRGFFGHRRHMSGGFFDGHDHFGGGHSPGGPSSGGHSPGGGHSSGGGAGRGFGGGGFGGGGGHSSGGHSSGGGGHSSGGGAGRKF
ncbi:MAG: TPM domain-containing protein [Clostridiales bacterium]|nr:TPM domain-containing protein [Clostridiales bacterium]